MAINRRVAGNSKQLTERKTAQLNLNRLNATGGSSVGADRMMGGETKPTRTDNLALLDHGVSNFKTMIDSYAPSTPVAESQIEPRPLSSGSSSALSDAVSATIPEFGYDVQCGETHRDCTFTGQPQPSIARSGQLGYLEVAPNPENGAAVSKWLALSYEKRQAASREIGDKILAAVLERVGIDAKVVHDDSFFECVTPSIRIEFTPTTAYAKARVAMILAGYIFRQQSVILADERIKVGDHITRFLRIEASRKLSAAERRAFLEHVGEGASCMADGSFVFGNFSELTDAEYFGAIHQKLSSLTADYSATGAFDLFFSECIDNLDEQVDNMFCESLLQNEEAGREVVREWSGWIRALRADFEKAFSRVTQPGGDCFFRDEERPRVTGDVEVSRSQRAGQLGPPQNIDLSFFQKARLFFQGGEGFTPSCAVVS